MPHGHRTAELRSIALHELVAGRLDGETIDRASERVERWIDDGGPVAPRVALRWRELLRLPPAALAAHLVEDSEEMRDLRQNTPFAGAIPPHERWRVISEVP
ncbi:hypothetical protein BH20ACT19_BH20ACT19_09440 [soil metagenome]